MIKQWFLNLIDRKCPSKCQNGKCINCNEYNSQLIIGASAIIGGALGLGATLIGQLFTGFDLEVLCLVPLGTAFGFGVAGVVICAEIGLLQMNEHAVQREIKKLENESFYRKQREENFRSKMHLYEMKMSNYRCFPSSSNYPTRPSY